MSKVHVAYSDYGIDRVDEEFIQFVFDVAISMAGINPEAEAGVMITDNEHMQSLNKKFRDKDKPTNVLSFAYWETTDKNFTELDDKNYLGDIFISRPILMEEASKENISDRERFVILFVHGLMHLAGMNHETAVAAKKMEEMEETIVAQVFDVQES